MIYVKFFIYQCSLFTTLFAINIVFDQYISKPFTRIDFIAICISLPITILTFTIASKSYIRFNGIRLRTKVLFLIPTFISSVLLLGLLEQLFFN